ncbi:MAG: S24 family peptidase [Blastocatellia bacterium]|nr:S24 family peptidase [Blastocatellia bacterium]
MIQEMMLQPTIRDAALPGGATGFPSPAEDYLHRALNLNDHLAPRPLSTFFIEVKGDAMAAEKIFDGDILVVDRAADIQPGQIVLAVYAGEFLLRKFVRLEGRYWLIADAGRDPVEVTEACEIWGRVMWSLTRL